MSRSSLISGVSALLLGCTFLAPVDEFEGSARPLDGGVEPGPDGGRAPDAGTRDSGPTRDAGPRDAKTEPDGGVRDAGGRDAGGRDAGTPDAGGRDAGTPDAGRFCDGHPNATFCSDFDRSSDLLADGWTDFGGPFPLTYVSMLYETAETHSPPGAARSVATNVPAKETAGRNLFATLNTNPVGRRYQFRLALPVGVPTGEAFVVCSMNAGAQYVSMTVASNEVGLYNGTSSVVAPVALPTGFSEIGVHLGAATTSLLVNGATVASGPALHEFPLGPSTFSLGLPYVEGPSSPFTTVVDDVVITDDP